MKKTKVVEKSYIHTCYCCCCSVGRWVVTPPISRMWRSGLLAHSSLMVDALIWRERERGREGGREGEREGGREGGREGEREGGRERGREEGGGGGGG